MMVLVTFHQIKPNLEHLSKHIVNKAVFNKHNQRGIMARVISPAP